MTGAVVGSLTYGTYLDLDADVKPWLQIPSGDTTKDAALRLITDMACTWVQNYIGGPVGITRYDRRFDGSAGLNGGYIMLPFIPVLDVVTVTEYNGNQGTVLAAIEPGTSGDGYQLTPATGRLTRVLGGLWNRPFYPGSRNIEVVWTAGYDPIPPDIKVATLEMCAHWFRNTQQMGARPGGGAIGEYDPASPPGLWQGVPNRITAMLTPYLRLAIA